MSRASVSPATLSGPRDWMVRWTAISRLRRTKLARTTQATTAARSQRRRLSTQQLDSDKGDRQRVLVLGSGWAGYTLARRLNPKLYQTVVISPRSYFAFTPLLASTAVGTLEFRTALEPVRTKASAVEYVQGWADGVDLAARTIVVEAAVEETMPGADPKGAVAESARRSRDIGETKRTKGPTFELGYDKLVVAVGCYSQTFGTPGVRENAFFLKDVKDARRIRQRLLACFDTASLPTTSDAVKKCLLNFAVVGGGRIEFSAELRDIITEDMAKLYPDLVRFANVTVYDVASQVLSMFDKKLSEYAMKTLQRENIKIMTSHHVSELRKGPPRRTAEEAGAGASKLTNTGYTLVTEEDGEIGVGMCVWSTGLMMNPFVQEQMTNNVRKNPKTGAIAVDGKLRVQRSDSSVAEDVFALGDCASVQDRAYPATAQVANQEALWLAKRLNARDISDPSTKGFEFKNLGVMAYLGNWNAILQSSGGEVSGRLAWFLWRSAYLTKAVSWRNKFLIPMYWFVNWAFGRDTSRF